MSYCRWSSECRQSDVYVYESAEGFNIHVAGRRYVSDAPRPEIPENKSDFVKYWEACDAWLKTAHLEDMNLPMDGKSLLVESAKECIDKLMELRGMGYHIPQSAIDALQEEIDTGGKDA